MTQPMRRTPSPRTGHEEHVEMDNVITLRPVARPALDAKAAELRAQGLIGGRGPVESSEPLTGEVVDPVRSGPSLIDALRALLGDREQAGQAGRELAEQAGRMLLVGYPAAVARGTAVAWRAWRRWVTAAEIKDAIKESGKLGDKWAEVRTLSLTRWKVTAAVAIPGMGALVVTLLVAPALPLVAAGAAASAGLAVAGRRKDGTPGRKSLLPSRGAMSWTIGGEGLEQAFIDAGIISKGQRLALTQRPRRDGDGWAAVVDLPPGRKASQAIARREDLASAVGVDEIQLVLNRVRGKGGHAGRLAVWVADSDPYAVDPTPSPLADAERWDLWTAVPFGSTARGQRVDLPMLWTSLLVGAIPRMGKTYAARIPATAAALDPHVRLIVFDGKGGKDWRPFEQVAHRFGRGDDPGVCARLLDVLEEAVADVQHRFEVLADLDDDICPESKVTPAITTNRRMGMPLVVIAIDEIQVYLEDDTPIEVGVDGRGKPKYRDRGDLICDALTYIAKKAPAAGYMLVLATQKPDADVLPDKLRGQLGTRLAMRTMTWQASETILGQGTYRAGYDSSKLLASHKGVGLLLGADGETDLDAGEATTVRTDLLGMAEVRAACERGRAARDAAGTLTGDAADDRTIRYQARAVSDSGPAADDTTQDPTEVPAILADLQAVMDDAGVDRMHTGPILAALEDRDGQRYAGWGEVVVDDRGRETYPAADKLALAARRYGVEPRQTPIRGVNRNGYRLADIEAAITAHTGH